MRAPSSVFVLVAALAACGDSGAATGVQGRADVVEGSVVVTGSVPPAKTSAGSTEPPKRKLCARPAPKPGAKPASVKMGTVQAEGESPLEGDIPTGGGKWTWINVWAGWCDPCLEEIPLLKSWEGERLRVAFVSVDDDPRLAERFLAKQPKTGVRRSFLLDKPDARKEWLESIGATLSSLPLQILVDPQGTVRCVANGSVYPTDLPEIQALIK